MKKKLGFWEIWNMSFGFLGIQFGFALQGGFMSRIFQTLGVEEASIPLLWIAAPLTGLIVQPIIGYLSDNTWHSVLGRRKPYFLIGAILSSVTLFFVPYSSTLWMAAGFLWILDASINISMEPFRALVADKLPDSQRSYGFVTQTLIIGIGTWIASNLPYFVSSLGVSDVAEPGVIPDSVKLAFAIGAFVFLTSILYTIFTTKEYPPKDLKKFRQKQNRSFKSMLNEFTKHFIDMPLTMKKLGLIQFFSWFAFFTMWSMANPAITEHVFNAPIPIMSDFDLSNKVELAQYNLENLNFQKASNLTGSYMGSYGLSSMLFALILTLYTSKKIINRKKIHLWSLIAGGIGFISMYFISNHNLLLISFSLIGISWGSILSMPYAMLSSSVKEESMGTSMGIFNMFIVIPQIIAAIGGINLLTNLIGDKVIFSMVVAGLSLIIAGLLNLLINDKKTISY
ncbi:MFS transporter [Flavobacteriaceae bacterium]|jgi:maltose/moltooligosaccharide transporter|nr:MFS transporter [Flavobacteriaceae bacterium]MDA7717514.1 MFS transporter [Flavobacteriaceae bacterium]MDB4601356.1 MFS transporter [Flavobacteriaceae bacterium]MDC0106282.1 MFS transporter [Flavobacteriaceae bacterium]MDC0355507.1 MFS transporter [Flavobacteriaceae bacterium]|tara:strand:+ start:3526 stop:4887 length:1362 start_codon:yes stop_codon:yes gene_type:complete